MAGPLVDQYFRNVSSFLPRSVVQMANSGHLDDAHQPHGQTLDAVALFADISGFTALAERCAVDGQDGAEQLTQTLNRYFGAFIDAVEDAGGDILKFAGDALLAAWPRTAAARALECARRLQLAVAEISQEQREELSMKVALSAGVIRLACVGGVLDRRELIASGAPLAELGAANDRAKPGDIVQCESFLQALADNADVNSAVSSTEPVTDLMLSEAGLAAGMRFIPAAIRRALNANQSDWLNENRTVSLVFVNLQGLGSTVDDQRAQAVMEALQMALYEQEGSINKISVDDKGISLLAALGMPPLTHADDPLRAVKAACRVAELLSGLGLQCGIGVVTGRVFCGVVGNAGRREYTLMGDSVNLSARLMQAALVGAARFSVMVDQATHMATRRQVDYGPVRQLALKGKTGEIPAWEPLGFRQTDQPVHASAVVGRDEECQRALQFLDLNPSAGREKVLLLEGRSGSGKSSLLKAFSELALGNGHCVVHSAANPMRAQSPWYAWQGVFQQWLAMRGEPLTQPALHHYFAGHAEIQELLPLLEAVLPIRFEDNQTTAKFTGTVRAEKTRQLLFLMLQQWSAHQPLCVFIEGIEWLDSQSFELIRTLLARLAEMPVRLVLSLDSDHPQASARRQALLQADVVQTMVLQPLADTHILAIARQVTGLATLPAAARQELLDRAAGSPLYAVQIVSAMLETGRLWVDELGTGHWRGNAEGTQAEQPMSIDQLIVSRIDKLPPDVQLSGKVSAVSGLQFELNQVQLVHPMQPPNNELKQHFEDLAGRGLIRPSKPDQFDFANPAIGKVFYEMLPGSQRRALHCRYAELLEDTHKNDLNNCRDLLAFHWWHACSKQGDTDPELLQKAATHRLALGQNALRLGASEEAEQHFQKTIALCERAGQSLVELEIDALLGLSATRSDRYGWGDAQAFQALEKARKKCDVASRGHQVFQALRGVWQVTVARSNYDQSQPLAAELLTLAESMKDHPQQQEMLAEARRAVGTTHFWLGRFELAEQLLVEALKASPATQEGQSLLNLTQDTEVSARGILAWAYALTDQHSLALKEAELAVELAFKGLPPFTQAYALGCAMWTCLHISDGPRAEYYAGETLRLSESLGFDYFVTAARVVFGWAKVWNGNPAGVADIQMAIEQWRARGNTMGVPAFLIQLARALRKTGQLEQAQAVLVDPVFVDSLPKEPWLGMLAYKMMSESP